MIKQTILIIGMIASFLTLAACAGPTRVKMDYGTSHKLAKFNQTLNADAEKNLKPVEGLDGVAARETIQRYRKDFERPTPPPVYMISVGELSAVTSK